MKNTSVVAMTQRKIPMIYARTAMNAKARLVVTQESSPTWLKTLTECLRGVHMDHEVTSRPCDQARRASG